MGFFRVYLLCRIMVNLKREYMASWVCVSGFIRSMLSVSVFRSSACVVSQVMKRPLKSFARASLRYVPL